MHFLKPTLNIESDTDEIDLSHLLTMDTYPIHVAVERGHHLKWTRHGETRFYNTKRLSDFLFRYDDQVAMKEAGRISVLPASCYTLRWDDLPSVRVPSPTVQVQGNPHTPPRHTKPPRANTSRGRR